MLSYITRMRYPQFVDSITMDVNQTEIGLENWCLAKSPGLDFGKVRCGLPKHHAEAHVYHGIEFFPWPRFVTVV